MGVEADNRGSLPGRLENTANSRRTAGIVRAVFLSGFVTDFISTMSLSSANAHTEDLFQDPELGSKAPARTGA